MSLDYVHQELGQEVTFLSGYYVPLNEFRLEHNGKEVLCVTGVSAIENACCGSGGCAYAIVPGYVVSWQSGKNEAGLPVSVVEPVKDGAARQDIAARLRETESVGSIDFW